MKVNIPYIESLERITFELEEKRKLTFPKRSRLQIAYWIQL